jgi:hypothetical protein
LALARETAGKIKPAKMAMMAITTSSSMRVKPLARRQNAAQGRASDFNMCKYDWLLSNSPHNSNLIQMRVNRFIFFGGD